jgi:hypothetical protein
VERGKSPTPSSLPASSKPVTTSPPPPPGGGAKPRSTVTTSPHRKSGDAARRRKADCTIGRRCEPGTTSGRAQACATAAKGMSAGKKMAVANGQPVCKQIDRQHLLHGAHMAIRLREHGIGRICTRFSA